MSRLVTALFCILLAFVWARADDNSFTNHLEAARTAENNRDLASALKIYTEAEQAGAANSPHLCVLARKYCDLMYLTNSLPVQKALLERALNASLAAIKSDSNNAVAHACAAVCYAKKSVFADSIKDQLNYSLLLKTEAEKTIALDPKQDIAYYLLGRWNFGVANVGMLSRAYVKVVYGGLPRASNEDAIANFKKAIEAAPHVIINHAGLAAVYEATGQKELEIAELKKCRELEPTGLEDRDAKRDAIRKLTTLGQ